MKTLLLLRHGHARSDLPVTDHDRPLSDRGERQSRDVGRWLSGAGLSPGRIISSTAFRAATTARIVAQTAGWSAAIELEARLYMAEPDHIIQTLRAQPDDAPIVLLVGHNPGLERLVAAFTGAAAHLSTASLACLEIVGTRWAQIEIPGDATLRELRHVDV